MEFNTSGERIVFLRNLSGLTRKEFEIKYNIPSITLRLWERSDHIKEKAAARFLTAIQQEDIKCDLEWILSGIGNPPILKNLISKTANNAWSLGSSFDEDIVEEISLLQKKYKNNFFPILISNNDNYPFLVTGDYAGGVFVDHLDKSDKGLYIAENNDGITLIRQISPTNLEDTYHLKALNQDIEFPILYNQKIKNLWRIIWIRKKL